MVGIGSGAGAVGIAAAVANRWFTERNGLAMGLLSAANAAGQLIFLPLLAMLAESYGWQAVAGAVTLAIAAMLPLIMILLPESPAKIGLGPEHLSVYQTSPELREREAFEEKLDGAPEATGEPQESLPRASLAGWRSGCFFRQGLDCWLGPTCRSRPPNRGREP